MSYATDKYDFDRHGNIKGWDEICEFKIEVRNTRELEVKVQIKRNFNTQHWELTKSGDYGDYKNVDLDTVKFTLKLKPNTKKVFKYTLTTHHGTRVE
jgi:hypothetical protein